MRKKRERKRTEGHRLPLAVEHVYTTVQFPSGFQTHCHVQWILIHFLSFNFFSFYLEFSFELKELSSIYQFDLFRFVFSLIEMERNLGKNFTENSLTGEQEWTTKASFTPEEEDAIATLVVVVVGIIIAIVVLFSMGVFIDCRQQKHDSETKKKRLKLKMPPMPRRRNQGDDERSLASNMHQGAMDFGAMGITGEAVV